MTIADIKDIVRDLRDQGIGILITDHQVREVLTVTDRSYLIKGGKVRTHGTPQQIIRDPIAIADYLGSGFSDERIGSSPTQYMEKPAGESISLVVEQEKVLQRDRPAADRGVRERDARPGATRPDSHPGTARSNGTARRGDAAAGVRGGPVLARQPRGCSARSPTEAAPPASNSRPCAKRTSRSQGRVTAPSSKSSMLSLRFGTPIPGDIAPMSATDRPSPRSARNQRPRPYGIHVLEVLLLRSGRTVHLTISPAAAEVIEHEMDRTVHLTRFEPRDLLGGLADTLPLDHLRYHDYRDFKAGIASGSFLTGGMVICPCSMGTVDRGRVLAIAKT